MKLSWVRFRNFTVFDDAHLAINRRVTVIVGPNDSGKTNILNLLHRVCRVAEFGFVSDDRRQVGQGSPQIDLTFTLDDQDSVPLKRALDMGSAPDTLRLHISGNEVRASGREAGPLRMVLDRRRRERLLDYLPTPILLGIGLRPMPASFDLGSGNPDPELLMDLLAFAGLGENDLLDVRADTRDTRRKLLEGAKALSDLLNRRWSQSTDLQVDLRSVGERLDVRIHEGALLGSVATRGHGLAWFLSFLVRLHRYEKSLPTFPLFLFDEPAANLHPQAQKDVRRLLNSLGESGQVIYATHSPFMVDWSQPLQVRILDRLGGPARPVRINNKPYTNGPIGLWEPFRRNLGLFLGDLGLLGETTVLVEGPSDQIGLVLMGRQVGDPSRAINPATQPLSIIPFGNSRAMLSLLELGRMYGRRVVILRDGDREGRTWKGRILRTDSASEVITTADVLPIGPERPNSSMEDLFDRTWFLKKVNEWAAVTGVSMKLSQSIVDPRKSLGSFLEQAFSRHGVEYSKMEVMAQIAARVEVGEQVGSAHWDALFERFAHRDGLIWLGVNDAGDEVFLHLVDRSVTGVTGFSVELTDPDNRQLAAFKGFSGTGMRLIDTVSSLGMASPAELTRYGRLECKIGLGLNEKFRGAASVIVRLTVGSQTRGYSVKIPTKVIEKFGPALDSLTAYLKNNPVAKIVKGRVISTGPYGFVVELAPGVTAFNHISEITGGWIEDIGKHVREGETVECMIIPAFRWASRKFDVSVRRARQERTKQIEMLQTRFAKDEISAEEHERDLRKLQE